MGALEASLPERINRRAPGLVREIKKVYRGWGISHPWDTLSRLLLSPPTLFSQPRQELAGAVHPWGVDKGIQECGVGGTQHQGLRGGSRKVLLMSLIWGSSPTSLIQDVAGKPCLLLPSHLQLDAPEPADEALLPQC